MTRIYIAGPMFGYPDKNKMSFQFARDMLEKLHDVPAESIANPWELAPYNHDGPCPNGQRKVDTYDKHAAGCYYRVDLFEMLQCQAVVLLPGWENSVGARLEMQVATACGLKLVGMDMKTGEVYDMQANCLQLDWWHNL